jgi:hypothetical protein
MSERRSKSREIETLPSHVEAGIGLQFDYGLLEELDPLLHQIVAEKLIDSDAVYYMLSNRDKFKNIDEGKLIEKILQELKQSGPLTTCSDQFQQFTQDEILDMVVQFELQKPPTFQVKERLVFSEGEGDAEISTPEDVIALLESHGAILGWENKKKRLADMLGLLMGGLGGKIADWRVFFSKDRMQVQDTHTSHHVEIAHFGYLVEAMRARGVKDDEIQELASQIDVNDMVDFYDVFLKKGQQLITEKMENYQAQFYETSESAHVWATPKEVASWSMDEYLDHCKADESSGRFLVHSTKDHTAAMLVQGGELVPAALVHCRDDLKKVSKKLDNFAERRGNLKSGDSGLHKIHGVSVGVHFSFDNHVEYSQAKYAAVFAAEALVNNHAIHERRKGQDNDIAVAGGLTNNYLDDTSHRISIKDLGFMMVPEHEKVVEGNEYVQYMDKDMRAALEESDLRVFYYKGSLADGISQLRERIGMPEDRVKTHSSADFCRNYSPVGMAIEANSRASVVAGVKPELVKAKNASLTGARIYPDNSFLEDTGVGSGRGNYFSVKNPSMRFNI